MKLARNVACLILLACACAATGAWAQTASAPAPPAARPSPSPKAAARPGASAETPLQLTPMEGAGHACHVDIKSGQLYRGRLMYVAGGPSAASDAASDAAAPHPQGGCAGFVLHCDNGTVLPLLDTPALASLHRVTGAGVPVEARGVLEHVDGRPVLRINVLHLVTTAGGRKYPFRGRCKHCGCRMEVDSAAEAGEACDTCKCHTTKAECIRY